MLLINILAQVQKFKFLCSKGPSGPMPKRPRLTFLWRPEPTVDRYAASADGRVNAMPSACSAFSLYSGLGDSRDAGVYPA